MTDYNDGKWHGVTDGKCPPSVDPASRVEWKNSNGVECETSAGSLEWGNEKHPVIAFRVTKPAPPKPREWWVVQKGVVHIGLWNSERHAVDAAKDYRGAEIIHVREVLE